MNDNRTGIAISLWVAAWLMVLTTGEALAQVNHPQQFVVCTGQHALCSLATHCELSADGKQATCQFLIAAVPFTVLGESKGRETRGSGDERGYCVSNPNHIQVLGGRSEHDRFGLAEAAEHSRKVQPVAPPSNGGDTMGGTFGTVTSSGPATL